MSVLPVFWQSGAGIKHIDDAGNSPVPELGDAIQHFWSGTGLRRSRRIAVPAFFLNADVQLPNGRMEHTVHVDAVELGLAWHFLAWLTAAHRGYRVQDILRTNM
jgi:hypothetical protein